MRSSKWLVAAVLVSGVAGMGAVAGPAAAMPPDPIDPPDCPTGYHPVGSRCVPDPRPPLPPANQPFGSMDLAQQTTSRDGVHVAGWAADRDTATTPIQVRISVDGGSPLTVTADANRPDVDAAIPGVGAAHGYDVVVPAAAGQHSVCVTALNVGRGVDQSLGCRTMDAITSFRASAINYDIAHAVFGSANLDTLARVIRVNRTHKDLQFELAGNKTVEESVGWKDTEGVNVEAEADFKVSVPFLDDSVETKVKLGGSLGFEQNGSTTTKTEFSWKDQIIAEARRKTVASVEVTEEQLSVPYTLDGAFVYASGATASGTMHGTFSGVSAHELQVEDSVYFLNGKPDDQDVHTPANTAVSRDFRN